MPVFAYRGLNADGRAVKGVIDADSARTARAKLRASGTFPTDLAEESAAAERESAKREWLPSLWRRKMPAADLALAVLAPVDLALVGLAPLVWSAVVLSPTVLSAAGLPSAVWSLAVAPWLGGACGADRR